MAATPEKLHTVTAADLIKRVGTLAPKLIERRAKGASLRRLPDETMADLVATTALRACMPARFGGHELPFGTHTDVAMELAKTCGSTGWVAGIIGSHNWWLGKYQIESQHEVWDNNADALVAAAFASKPGTKAVAVDGGYRVSGEWMWCSGIDHCDWCSLMTPVPQASGPPDLVMVLLKRGDYTVHDVWNVPGMKATGSNNVIVDDLFVPKYRATRVAELNNKASPGQKLNESWIYKLPMLDVFGYSVAGPTLGCARGALEGFIASMTGRSGLDGSKVTDHPTLQARVAESSAEIDAAQALYDTDMAFLRATAQANGDLTSAEIGRIKRNCAYVVTLAKRAASRLIEAMGANGVSDSNPVAIAFADTMAGASHRALNWDVNGVAYGKILFGAISSPDAELLKRQVAAAKAVTH
jgi:3-hydroxy-9,10-secoandrosta-1,3,5(10)-triene-9,17-dione monooxygenase